MTTHLKSLEELVRELPPERQTEVRSFVESLLAQEYLPASLASAGQARSFEQCFGVWDSGDVNSADNERIDADLAQEYGATHESHS